MVAICYQVSWIDCQGEEIYGLVQYLITILKSFKFVLVWHRTCEKIERHSKGNVTLVR